MLGMMIFEQLEHGYHRARGQVGFKRDFKTSGHIFTVWTIIEEAHH
jgi:hypothetical protein